MKKFIKKYEVNYYDIDSNQKCKFTSIVNYLCDVGTSHSAAIGETIDVLLNEKNILGFFINMILKCINIHHMVILLLLKQKP